MALRLARLLRGLAPQEEPAPEAGPVACQGEDLARWALIAHVADTHINSTVGLCPPRFPRDDGGIYYPSKGQLWLWEKWGLFWDFVDERQGAMQAQAPPGVAVPLFIIFNGDIVDMNKHSAVQMIEAENPVPVLDAAEEALDRPVRRADRVFVIRGTEAHTGAGGFLEEALAQRLGAEKDPGRDTWSWFALACRIAGVGGDFCHHPATSSRRPWTRDWAAARQASITWSEYTEIGLDPPQVVGRAHVHNFARGWRAETFCFFSPPWQLTTSFGHRIGVGRRISPVGGVLIECRDGVADVIPKLYRADPGPVWEPPAEIYRRNGDGSWTAEA